MSRPMIPILHLCALFDMASSDSYLTVISSHSTSAQRYRDIRIALDRTEEFFLVVDKVCDIIFYIIYVALTPAQRVAPKRARPQSILATIPIPLVQKSSEGHATDLILSSPDTHASIPAADPLKPSLPTDDLLLSPAESSALPSVQEEQGIMSGNPSIIISPPNISASPSPSIPTKSTTTANA